MAYYHDTVSPSPSPEPAPSSYLESRSWIRRLGSKLVPSWRLRLRRRQEKCTPPPPPQTMRLFPGRTVPISPQDAPLINDHPRPESVRSAPFMPSPVLDWSEDVADETLSLEFREGLFYVSGTRRDVPIPLWMGRRALQGDVLRGLLRDGDVRVMLELLLMGLRLQVAGIEAVDRVIIAYSLALSLSSPTPESSLGSF